MTTLPQTTSVRLPRPAVPAALAPATPSSGIAWQMTGADVLRIMRANVWLILGMLALSAIIGFGVEQFLERRYPEYTAWGFVGISAARNVNPLETTQIYVDERALALEQFTQASLLKNDALMGEVLQKIELRRTEWFKQFLTAASGATTQPALPNVEQAKEELRDHFEAVAIPNTKLIRVAMSWKLPNECKTIVEVIVNEHLDQQAKRVVQRNGERYRILLKMKNALSIDQRGVASELAQLGTDLSVKGMVPGKLSSKEMELGEMTKKQLELTFEEKQAKSTADSFENQVKQGIVPGTVEEAVARDSQVDDFERNLKQWGWALEDLERKLGPDHPEYKRTLVRRDSVLKTLEQRKQELTARYTASLLERYRTEVNAMGEMLKELEQRIQELKVETGKLSNMMARYLTLLDEQKVVREMLKKVEDQRDAIENYNQQQNVSGVEWATPVDIPDRMSFPRIKYTMAIALALGLALSLAVAFLRELMDTTVRSPRDITRVGQMNVLGVIADESDDPQAVGARLPLVIAEAPHSIIAEQFRQVRTRLQHAASLDTTRSILISSPGPGDGKTTVACNVAAGLALNGRKILLVDANFRRPEIHKIFAISNERGFSDALSSVANFESSARETLVPNLVVMPSGPKPANPTELLESQLLLDFIEHALQEYDHVIFDTGPFLFVSETAAMAPRVDGVITVVRARTNTRGLLQRMCEALRQVKAEHLGVVLNAVRAQGGGYYGRNIKTYYDYQDGQGSQQSAA